MKVETINLQELLTKMWGVESAAPFPDGTAVVDSIRRREGVLRRYLPMGVVHRLDSCFARSNTVHPETGHALYSICRASQAKCVFETGTYWGYSTSYLAAALQNNGGKVWSFDIYPKAGKHIPRSLRRFVELYRGKPSTEMMPEVLRRVQPDLFFQDSRHDYEGVTEELQVVAPHLKPNAIILFHDFVMPDVRQAAHDVLKNYKFYVIETSDPQQLGLAVHETRS